MHFFITASLPVLGYFMFFLKTPPNNLFMYVTLDPPTDAHYCCNYTMHVARADLPSTV